MPEAASRPERHALLVQVAAEGALGNAEPGRDGSEWEVFLIEDGCSLEHFNRGRLAPLRDVMLVEKAKNGSLADAVILRKSATRPTAAVSRDKVCFVTGRETG